jgi:hypothetical protein
MRIQFEIKQLFSEIMSEILHSDKWLTVVKEEKNGLKRVVIKDPYHDSEAKIEIWESEIHLTTAWSNYTYRFYKQGDCVWCEYIGAYRGLLEQTLLPKITPKENFLDSKVSSSTLIDKENESLRHYSIENARNKMLRQEIMNKKQKPEDYSKDHPKVVYDEFIKIGIPLPPPDKI